MAGRAGRPRWGLGGTPREVECSKARATHAILEGAARADMEEGGRQQVEAPCLRMEGRQSAEDRPTNQQLGPRSNLDPSSTGPGPGKVMPKGRHYLGSTARRGDMWAAGQREKWQGEKEELVVPRRENNEGGDGAQRDSVHQGNS